MGWVTARRNVEHGSLVDAEQAGGIALVNYQVSQRGHKTAGKIQLPLVLADKAHRAAAIQHEVTTQVGFRFELLEVKPVGAGEDAPIQAPDVVTRHVVSVFGKLDARAPVGAL